VKADARGRSNYNVRGNHFPASGAVVHGGLSANGQGAFELRIGIELELERGWFLGFWDFEREVRITDSRDFARDGFGIDS
jgi:hypothetical protein